MRRHECERLGEKLKGASHIEILNGPVGACTTHVPIIISIKSFILSSLAVAERVGFEPCKLQENL